MAECAWIAHKGQLSPKRKLYEARISREDVIRADVTGFNSIRRHPLQPVDRQQFRLYDAQYEAVRGTPLAAPLSTSECIGLNNLLFARAKDRGFWPIDEVPPLKFVPKIDHHHPIDGRATWYTALFTGAYIMFTPTGRQGILIAHEAAHILCMAGRPSHAHFEHHGKEYAAVFIWAVSALFGVKWSNRLKRAFAEAKIEAICSLQED